MHVDPRVAHGLARHELGKNQRIHGDGRVLDIQREVVARMGSTIFTSSRRDFMRRLERVAAPALRRMDLDPWVGSAEMHTGMLVSLVTRSPENGIRRHELFWSADTRGVQTYVPVSITPHALARCMQRNGVMGLREIERQTWLALELAPLFQHVAHQEGWKQVGVPTGDGLFVGESDSTVLVLKTFIQPGENGRRSRWDRYWNAVGDIPPADRNVDRSEVSQAFEWLKPRLLAKSMTSRVCDDFPFVTEPYEQTEDPHDARWDAALR